MNIVKKSFMVCMVLLIFLGSTSLKVAGKDVVPSSGQKEVNPLDKYLYPQEGPEEVIDKFFGALLGCQYYEVLQYLHPESPLRKDLAKRKDFAKKYAQLAQAIVKTKIQILLMRLSIDPEIEVSRVQIDGNTSYVELDEILLLLTHPVFGLKAYIPVPEATPCTIVLQKEENGWFILREHDKTIAMIMEAIAMIIEEIRHAVGAVGIDLSCTPHTWKVSKIWALETGFEAHQSPGNNA